jgi:hypothetical protein
VTNSATMPVNRITEDHVPRWITARDAARLLGVNSNRITQLIREGRLQARPHPLDKRSKILDRGEVEDLLAELPEPLEEE